MASRGCRSPTAFQTANGKARIYNEELIAEGMDPVASYVAPEESRHQASAKQYPLELLARKADNFLNSTFVNLTGHQKMERRRDELEIAYDDAKRRGIANGDRVRVFNDRGEIFLTRVSMVRCRWAWSERDWDGRGCRGRSNINVLTSARLTDLGGVRHSIPRWSRSSAQLPDRAFAMAWE